MKISLFAIATLFIFATTVSSCKKGNTGLPSNTIQATINGKTSTFNVGGIASPLFDTSTGNYNFGVIGGTTPQNTLSAEIILNITSPSPITTTTYSENSGTNNASVYYAPNLDLAIHYSNAHITSNLFTITVTSISQTSMQGRFKGNIYYNGDSTQTLETITNGKFNVNL